MIAALVVTLGNVATAVALACTCTSGLGGGTQCTGETCTTQPDGDCICSGGSGCSCFAPGGASCSAAYCKAQGGGGCTCSDTPILN